MGCEVEGDDFIDDAVVDGEDVLDETDVVREVDGEEADPDVVERYVTTGVLVEELIDMADLREKYADAIVE